MTELHCSPCCIWIQIINDSQASLNAVWFELATLDAHYWVLTLLSACSQSQKNYHSVSTEWDPLWQMPLKFKAIHGFRSRMGLQYTCSERTKSAPFLVPTVCSPSGASGISARGSPGPTATALMDSSAISPPKYLIKSTKWVACSTIGPPQMLLSHQSLFFIVLYAQAYLQGGTCNNSFPDLVQPTRKPGGVDI